MPDCQWSGVLALNQCDEALLCRGLGRGAYESMKTRGIRPILTDIASIDEVVKAYLDGTIVDLTDLLH